MSNQTDTHKCKGHTNLPEKRSGPDPIKAPFHSSRSRSMEELGNTKRRPVLRTTRVEVPLGSMTIPCPCYCNGARCLALTLLHRFPKEATPFSSVLSPALVRIIKQTRADSALRQTFFMPLQKWITRRYRSKSQRVHSAQGSSYALTPSKLNASRIG